MGSEFDGRFYLKRTATGKLRIVDRDPPPHRQEIVLVVKDGEQWLHSLGYADGDDISIDHIYELREDECLHVSTQAAPREYIHKHFPPSRSDITTASDAHALGLPVNYTGWPKTGRPKRRELAFSKDRQELYFFIAVGGPRFMTLHLLRSGLPLLAESAIRVGDTLPEELAIRLQQAHTYTDRPIVGFGQNQEERYLKALQWEPAPWSPEYWERLQSQGELPDFEV